MKTFKEFANNDRIDEAYKFSIGAKQMIADLQRCLAQSDPNGNLCKGLSKGAGMNFSKEFKKLEKLLTESVHIYEDILSDVEYNNM